MLKLFQNNYLTHIFNYCFQKIESITNCIYKVECGEMVGGVEMVGIGWGGGWDEVVEVGWCGGGGVR